MEMEQLWFPWLAEVALISDPIRIAIQHHYLCEHDEASVAPLQREFARSLNYPMALANQEVPKLGMGAAKVTYALPCGHHVLKLDKVPGVHGQTQREIEMWLDSEDDPELRAILCPIDAHGDNWIVARMADMDGDALCEIEDEERRNLARVANSHGIGDIYGGNVGYLKGKPVVIDYGYDNGLAQSSSDSRYGLACDCSMCRGLGSE